MMDAFELPRTLVESLQRRAAQAPDQVALRFLAESAEHNVVLSYRDLDQRARTIAAALQANAAQGDRAVLLFPSGPDYVLSLIHISEPTRQAEISYAVFCLKKKNIFFSVGL